MTAEERIAALEQRLRRVEDELAIGRLLASYGPLVDAGDADAVAELWAPDGEYSVEGWHMQSRSDVADMVRSAVHQELIGGGSAHFLGPVCVDVDGDEGSRRRDLAGRHALASSWRSNRNVRLSRSGRVVRVTSTAPPDVMT